MKQYMRRILRKMMIPAAVCVLAAGCVSEELPAVDEETADKVSYCAEINDDVSTKTSIGDRNQVLWSSGDEIVVFEKNSIGSRHILLDTSDGSPVGEFTEVVQGGSGSYMGHNVAFYPYCETSCKEAGPDSYVFTDIYFPAEQTYVAGSFAQKAFPMVAVSDDEELTFRNVGGALKLMLKGDCNVASIILTGNDNEYISGKADVIVYADGTDPEVNMQESARKTVSLDCGGVALNPDTATEFIIVLPPVTFEKGFTVTVKVHTGEEMTVSAKVANSVRRSSILKMPEITVAPEPVEETVLTECPFKRGINISDWLLHDTEEYVISSSYTEKDFHDLKSLGFDAVRLPVDFKNHVGLSPDYVINDYLLECIDKAVNWAENTGMYIVIDNHSYLGESFPNEGPAVLKKVFAQLADRYKDRSDKVMYELFNEPNENDLSLKLLWGILQPSLIDIIRSVDRKHTIIVSGFGSSIENLEDIAGFRSRDSNLIYTFHFYTPSLFTHQGADWGGSPMQYLSGPVPFPYDADKMPPKPSEFVGSYNEKDYDEYPSRGNVAYIRERLQVAVDFADTYGVPVYCGEWGVLNRLASQEDYCCYHQAVKEIMEENGIAWTLWAYRDDFSIFNRGSACMFGNDLNVRLLNALDLNVPEGYVSSMPSEVLFYDDAAAFFTKPSSYNYYAEMTLDSRYSPYAGNRCIEWTLGGKYASVTFEIWPVADFTDQAARDYELAFMIRSDETFSAPLTVRFVEYDEETVETWRYSFMLDNSVFASDGQWHGVRIPMSSFANAGGYKGSTWQNADSNRPCDWTKINKLEFAVEGQSALIGMELFLDEIRIVVPEDRWYMDGFSRNETTWNW